MTNMNNDPMKYMFFTPAGVACDICNSPFTPNRWRYHFNTNHPTLGFSKQSDGFAARLSAHVTTAIKNEDRESYAASTQEHIKHCCTNCRTAFANKSLHQSHCMKETQEGAVCTVDDHVMANCYKSRCGRFFVTVPGALDNDTTEMQQEESKSDDCKTDTCLEENAQSFMGMFGKLPMCYQNKSGMVKNILEQIINSHDEDTEWKKIFHKRIANDPNFIATITADLEVFNNSKNIITENIALSRLLDTFAMLESNFHSIVSGTQGNVRCAMVKFKVDEGGDVDNPSKWGFRPRDEKCKDQLNEFRAMLCYMLKHQCPMIKKYMDIMKNPHYSIEEAHNDGVICKLIYELATEEVTNGEYIPIFCEFAQSRCFKVAGDKVTIRSANKCGSLFSTLLYILREGVLSCASLMENAGNATEVENMIRCVQRSPVTNILSPWINVCRKKYENEFTESSNYNENGDIICQNALFKKSLYCKLIPLIRTNLIVLFAEAFKGDDWRHFIHNNGIIVSKPLQHIEQHVTASSYSSI